MVGTNLYLGYSNGGLCGGLDADSLPVPLRGEVGGVHSEEEEIGVLGIVALILSVGKTDAQELLNLSEREMNEEIHTVALN